MEIRIKINVKYLTQNVKTERRELIFIDSIDRGYKIVTSGIQRRVKYLLG